MNWHYMSAGQQMGPVDEAALHELFRSGTVRPDSLVWRAGMDGWKSYASVFQAAPPTERYGGFWIRVVASILDVIIVGVASSIIRLPLFLMMGRSVLPAVTNPDFANNPNFLASPEFSAIMGMVGLSWAIGIAIDAAYNTIFVGLRGATPGKMALGLKIVRADGEPLGMGLALGRWAATWVSRITLCIGYIIAAFDAQKRTLHDHICGTRVVRVAR